MILITGGTGYIGSHVCVTLIEAGYAVAILDNLSNSHAEVINRIQQITGIRPHLFEGDIRDDQFLKEVFSEIDCEAVMHFAGLKAVGESSVKPLEYYDNNVRGTFSLLHAMNKACVSTIVFSSSATVYGEPAEVPIMEDFPCQPTNPYGRTKLVIEDVLADLCSAEPHWKIARLRYFNPVGAHKSGLIGEDPKAIPNNLMPLIAQVVAGKRGKLSIFGNDYPTPDGTGVRDYIHVVDLAEGHMAALKYLQDKGGLLTVNLGTGRGYSVLELIGVFENATGQSVPYEMIGRRAGDVAACYADCGRADKLLGWKAQRGTEAMCLDTWRWQKHNPDGYHSLDKNGGV